MVKKAEDDPSKPSLGIPQYELSTLPLPTF